MYAVAILAPLVGSLIAGAFGRAFGDRFAQTVTIACMVVAAICGVGSLFDVLYATPQPGAVELGAWFNVGHFQLDWALRRDTLSSVMVAMVTTVATLIHIYSVGYMAHERRPFRFFAYLSLFSFAMLMLVSADNLVQLFFGWEGVGLASYLLIGFWYQKPSANAAAIKAFVVNRIGDFGFALGIFAVFMMTGAVDFDTIFAQAPALTGKTIHLIAWDFDAPTLICLLLFMG